MAAPASKTLKDLSGNWTLNKTLSDSSEPVLALQGIGYLTRKAIGLASITLDIQQFEAAPKPPNTATDIFWHIVIDQSASGLSSTQEHRCLDDFARESSDWLFGAVKSRSLWASLDKVDDEFLKGNWEVDAEGQEFVLTVAESQGNGWVARQVWGFQKVDGERRYCRNIVVTKGEQRVQIRLVYDYNP